MFLDTDGRSVEMKQKSHDDEFMAVMYLLLLLHAVETSSTGTCLGARIAVHASYTVR